MPAWVKNDDLWKKAEEVWEDMPTKERSGKDKWAYIAGIYKQMGGKVKNSSKFNIGDRVVISGGSGLFSDEMGIIVPSREIKTDYRGVPINVINKHYKPVDWSKEVVVKLDNGDLITMFKNRVMKVKNSARGGYADPFMVEDQEITPKRFIDLSEQELKEKIQDWNRSGVSSIRVQEYVDEWLKHNRVPEKIKNRPHPLRYELQQMVFAGRNKNSHASYNDFAEVLFKYSDSINDWRRYAEDHGMTVTELAEQMKRFYSGEIRKTIFKMGDVEEISDYFGGILENMVYEIDWNGVSSQVLSNNKVGSRKNAKREPINKENWKGEMGEVDYDETTGIFELVDYGDKFKLDFIEGDSNFVFYNIISLSDGRKVGVVYGDAMEGGWYTAESNGITREDENIYLAAAKLLYNTI